MPQPVDLQTELGRVTAAERVQQIADRASLAAHHRAAAQAQQEQVQAETQVKESLEAERRQAESEGRHASDETPQRRKPKGDEPDEAETAARVFYNAEEKSEVIEDPDRHRLDVSG